MQQDPSQSPALLLTMYIAEFLVSIITFRFLLIYLWGRFKLGAVSLFMLSLLVFSFFFGVQNFAAILIRIVKMYPELDRYLNQFSFFIWTLSHMGTMISFYCMGVLVVKKRFDLYVTRINNQEKERGDDDVKRT